MLFIHVKKNNFAIIGELLYISLEVPLEPKVYEYLSRTFTNSFFSRLDKHWFGLTLRHLNKPNISMLSQGDLPLDLFISAHASLELPFLKYNNDNSVNFIMNFVKQAKYDRFDFGFQQITGQPLLDL